MAAIPEEVTPPRTARIAPAVLLPASPCRVARLARFVRKRCPRFPSAAVMQPAVMADRASRSNPSRALGRPQFSTWRVGVVRAGRRRKGANSPRPGGGRQQPFGRPVPDTGERVIYAECVAADGRRSRMRPGPMYSGTNTPGRQETAPRLQPMRLNAARPPPAVPSIPIRPAHPGCRLARRQPSVASPHAYRTAASMPVERSRRTPINTRSGPPWVKRRKSLPHLHGTTGQTLGTSPPRPCCPTSRDHRPSRSR